MSEVSDDKMMKEIEWKDRVIDGGWVPGNSPSPDQYFPHVKCPVSNLIQKIFTLRTF